MQGMIHITVKLFGPVADAVGETDVEYALAAQARLADLLELMYAKYPALAKAAAALRFAINQEYADLDAGLADGDEVAIIPPVAGGQEPLRVELTTEPIDVSRLEARVGHPSCGALVTFNGVVRAGGSADNPLVAIEYSAYEPMAHQQLCHIRQEAIERFSIHQAAISHRLGVIEVGQTALAVAVAARHRPPAFEACAWIIDGIKLDVPIWKKELWARSQPTWVDPAEEASE